MDSLDTVPSLTGWPGCFAPAPSRCPPRRAGEADPHDLVDRAGMQRVRAPDVDLFMLREFLDEAMCSALIEQIEARHRPSTVLYGNGDSSFRTSETCDLSHRDPIVRALDARLAEISGIDPAHGESLQGQRYAVGQEFKAHTDTFDPHSPESEAHCAIAGQRTWTFLLYLNDVEAGGATRFPRPDRIIQPERGKLVCWNNRLPDGSPNPATLHHALKVRRGVKYVVTRWYRERPWQ